MSMENGFELDFPADDCPFGCMPMDHGEIGEPDSASLDSFARPVAVYSTGLEVNVGRPHGRSFHLSFARPTAFGSDTQTVRLKTERELRDTLTAIADYLGVDIE